MSFYHVYGVGDALVDIEFQIEETFFSKTGLKKGTRCVIEDLQTQEKLLANLRLQSGLKSCGGSAGNTIYAIAQFGGKSFFCCKVANDALGDFFFQALLQAHIHSTLEYQPRSAGITGHCLVFVTPDGERTMCSYLGAAKNLTAKDIDQASLKSAQVLYLEAYLAADPSTFDAALFACKLAKNNGIPIAFSLSDPDITQHYKKQLLQILDQGIDILFCNEQEALLFSNCTNIITAATLLKRYTKRLAITQGEKGALLFEGDDSWHIPPTPVTVKDTLGAGDMFAGATLYGLSQGFNFVSSGHFACAAASQIVGKYGPRLLMSEAKEFLQTHYRFLKTN